MDWPLIVQMLESGEDAYVILVGESKGVCVMVTKSFFTCCCVSTRGLVRSNVQRFAY